jgi:chromosome segregation ATPase
MKTFNSLHKLTLILGSMLAFHVTAIAQSASDRAATAQMQIDVINNGIALKQVVIQTLERDIAASNAKIAAQQAKKSTSPKNAAAFESSIQSETAFRDSTQAKLNAARQYIAERQAEKAKREAELRNANANIAREKARNPGQPDGLSLDEALKKLDGKKGYMKKQN